MPLDFRFADPSQHGGTGRSHSMECGHKDARTADRMGWKNHNKTEASLLGSYRSGRRRRT